MLLVVSLICIVILFAASWITYGSDVAFFVFIACVGTLVAATAVRENKK
jgi:hypothetical protein